jgi:uncharacterized protein YbcI
MPDTAPERATGGQLHAAISNAVIRVVAEYTGRGPTRARTMLHGDWLFVALEDTLTKGERKLVEIGRNEFVIQTRRTFQTAMREELTAEITALTGRKVIAFFSDNHLNPDMALEAMLLEPQADADQRTGTAVDRSATTP